MEHGSWLTGSLVYLAAAVLAVPIAKALGLGSIIGYLAAGILIGPWGLKFVTDPQDMLHFAEFGVVLMLFLVGLELEPRRLWALRRPIFGWGSVQLFGSAALMCGAAVLLGVDWRLALVAALGLAMSSTAIGLGVMAERNLMATTSGQSVLSVMLLQDVAAIPILALVPLLAVSAEHAQGGGWFGAAKAVGVIALIVLGGRLLLRPALRWIARSKTPEIFTAASLLLVVATAALMQSVGLSMALGAFLAGVLLAESEYRRELETDIEPFKGLLLGLFFIAVGMSIDFAVVMAQPLLVAGLVLGFLVVKGVVLWAMGRTMPIPVVERPPFIILLAQGGEFGFVVFQTAAGAGVIDAPSSSLLVAAVAISMLLTPLVLLLSDRWWAAHLAAHAQGPQLDEISEPQHAPVIIAGFGRYGQIVGRLLYANGFAATVLEHDAEQVEAVRRFGWPVFYGDATRLDLLRTAGADKARVMVLAIDDIEQSVEVAKLVREHFPRMTIVARARNVTHYYELRNLGVEIIERETLDAALMSGRSVLELLGFERHQARTLALRFRRHNVAQLEVVRPHFGDEAKLIAFAKQGRQQLEELFAQEREAARQRTERAGWGGQDAEPDDKGRPAPR
ncbi:glutathione-regulated potassium-efflux system protein KefC [Piscinibacter sp.]|uniref:glutathione-regulated potassium-efflux system protein KefC n=1 Tax=Piscinibacter sp. TaxID=1903157 RepID=UPI001B643126|nr:glutathione-regulated potassium-efflux system protein KefC [Piscinibacter sp.]MBK7529418.1 glutathione-regulated potassium-efflux system protein KefC [Piscinibacter sp.]MBL0092350.1 glutathione-regulated potassium-efflux system protein KefC [Piscinibacter sp.]MBP6544662.1 glutathione-regulated potassium-efflux system protein KefC [Piscinibacter sp.]